MPILLLAAANVVRPAVTLARPQWTWFPLSTQLLETVLSIILVKFMINVASQTQGGEWYPFLTPADSVRSSPHYIVIAAIVNVSISDQSGLCVVWTLHRRCRPDLAVSEVRPQTDFCCAACIPATALKGQAVLTTLAHQPASARPGGMRLRLTSVCPTNV